MDDNGDRSAITARFARDAVRNARAQIGDPVEEAAALTFAAVSILEARFGRDGAALIFERMTTGAFEARRAAEA